MALTLATIDMEDGPSNRELTVRRNEERIWLSPTPLEASKRLRGALERLKLGQLGSGEYCEVPAKQEVPTEDLDGLRARIQRGANVIRAALPGESIGSVSSLPMVYPRAGENPTTITEMLREELGDSDYEEYTELRRPPRAKQFKDSWIFDPEDYDPEAWQRFGDIGRISLDDVLRLHALRIPLFYVMAPAERSRSASGDLGDLGKRKENIDLSRDPDDLPDLVCLFRGLKSIAPPTGEPSIDDDYIYPRRSIIERSSGLAKNIRIAAIDHNRMLDLIWHPGVVAA
jgi:hypothetical protein